jgi:hypothetical protein
MGFLYVLLVLALLGLQVAYPLWLVDRRSFWLKLVMCMLGPVLWVLVFAVLFVVLIKLLQIPLEESLRAYPSISGGPLYLTTIAMSVGLCYWSGAAKRLTRRIYGKLQR